jgi:hypothetical protein
LQIDRSEIEASLAAKGFIKEDSHHRYFYHEVEGKRSGVFTYTSHGSHYKTIGDNLLETGTLVQMQLIRLLLP